MASPTANTTPPQTPPQPQLEQIPTQAQKSPKNGPPSTPATPARRSRTSTNASNNSVSSRLRSASLKLIDANPPPGMWAASTTSLARAPTLSDIRKGSYGSQGWSEESQKQMGDMRGAQGEEAGQRWLARQRSSPGLTNGLEAFPAVVEEPTRESSQANRVSEQGLEIAKEADTTAQSRKSSELVETRGAEEKKKSHWPHKRPEVVREYTNGYVPPPKLPWTTSTAIALKAFWKFFLTPTGFLITLYGLNVVAWGGMLFLLLCNAAPAMCHPSCDANSSPRKKWLEIDSQILNGLFCVTGFGLAPWRFRDLYWWCCWRLGGSKRKEQGIRTLAGIHRAWFRLPGSDQLRPLACAKDVSAEDPAVPLPIDKIPDPPPTGHRASPTAGWKLDFVVWMNCFNTFFQVLLCFYMWHYNRLNRPGWATGTFVAMGCVVAMVAGFMMSWEGRRVKKVEGIPPEKRNDLKQEADVERGEAK